ncbi:GntR family transcriptional regulator [Kallotenue papyrolyticum]|uniref:GntR family transcriptional regulator n=1 Tax=Kallotenue papyrolyticum TaxID=1325125 RepID=UPI0004785B4F|nr:GntR family transcriptional regulator [Kallotenue papyrolyticum]
MRLSKFDQPRYRTKQEFVYHTLREAIMRGELAPGQRLRIEELAQQLGVSPIPVREALQMLQSERLVENVPHVGATVARISKDAITEIFTVMEGLEMVATRAAAQRLTPDALQHLTTLLQAMDQAVANQAYDEWSELNTQWHSAVVQIAGMPMLQEMTERVLNQWDRVRRYYLKGVLVHRMAQAQQEHWQILEAMRTRDYERLERLVRQHNQGALAAYTEYLAQPATAPAAQ